MTTNEVELIEKLIALWIVRSKQKYGSSEFIETREVIEDIKKHLAKDVGEIEC